MEKVLSIIQALIQAFQLLAGVAFVYCLLKAGFKSMICQEKRSEIKYDLMWAIGGLILALGCFPLTDYIKGLISF